MPTQRHTYNDKFLDNSATEFSSGEKIIANTRYLLKIPSTITNTSLFYLRNTRHSTIFATLTEQFSYSTSTKGIESNIVIGRATKTLGTAQPTHSCNTKEVCKVYKIQGTPTEDTLINGVYSSIRGNQSVDFDFGDPVFAVVKFSESHDISFWKSKVIQPTDVNNQKFLFTPLYLMVGTIVGTSGNDSNLFVVK